MLDPKAPKEPEPVRTTYEKKFGGPAQAEQVLNTVTTEAAGEGLDFNMDIALRSNTLSAHRLLVLAEREGTQIALKERLMKAYFVEGGDVGNHDLLIGYCVEVGMEEDMCRAWLDDGSGRADVVESLEFCAANGLASVPTYVFDRRVAVPGAQPPETFARILEKVATTEGPEQLIEP